MLRKKAELFPGWRVCISAIPSKDRTNYFLTADIRVIQPAIYGQMLSDNSHGK